MKLSIVRDFLADLITVNEFKKNISSEVNEFIHASKKKGGSIPIYLEEDCNLFIGREQAILLLQLYKQNILDEDFIAYIVDALLLSESIEFESEDFLESLETLTDPEVNGKLSILRADQLLNQFGRNK